MDQPLSGQFFICAGFINNAMRITTLHRLYLEYCLCVAINSQDIALNAREQSVLFSLHLYFLNLLCSIWFEYAH